MVSYIDHNRRGPPRTGGCGCGGARAPIPLQNDWEKKIKELTTHSTASVPATVPIAYPQKFNSARNINQDLMKPDKLAVKEKSIEFKPVEVKKEPEYKPIDLRKMVPPTSRGISRENSYNKMNLPRKGCCGTILQD